MAVTTGDLDLGVIERLAPAVDVEELQRVFGLEVVAAALDILTRIPDLWKDIDTGNLAEIAIAWSLFQEVEKRIYLEQLPEMDGWRDLSVWLMEAAQAHAVECILADPDHPFFDRVCLSEGIVVVEIKVTRRGADGTPQVLRHQIQIKVRKKDGDVPSEDKDL